MHKFFSPLLIAITLFFAVPQTTLAAAIINVDIGDGNGRQSLCKGVGEISVNEEDFDDNIAVNIFGGDYVYFGGKSASVGVRAIASNTGDTAGKVNYSISYNGTPGIAAMSHQFTVTVDGETQVVTANTSPDFTTVQLSDSYKFVRKGETASGNPLSAYNDTQLFPAVTSLLLDVPASGLGFGNSFKQYGCNGYGMAQFEDNKMPNTWAFEQGLMNVYTVTKKSSVVQPTATTCNVTLSANPSVTSGNSSVLSWTSNAGSTNCTPAVSCVAENSNWSTNGNSNGNTTVYSPGTNGTTTTNYQVRCNFPDGTQKNATTSVTWQNTVPTNSNCPVNLDATPSVISVGGSIGLNWTATGSSCTAANYCFADDNYAWGNGQLANTGYRTFVPSGVFAGNQLNFRIKCYYPDSSIRTDDAYVTVQGQVLPPQPPPPQPCVTCIIPPNPYVNPGNSGTSGIAGSPIVRTLAARSIEKTSGKLRGYFNANGCPAISTWFEYSDDKSNLDQRSDDITQANKYGNVEFVATNLRANTKYYYRIVGENCKGVSLGAIESFRTATGAVYTEGSQVGTPAPKPVTVVKESVTKTTVVDTTIKTSGAGTSYLRLDITNDNDIPDDNEPVHTVIRGEVVVYRVVWENLTSSMLHDGKIRVNLPKILSFMNSSNGIYDRDSHSVYMTIGDIVGRASGVEFITVQVGTNGQVGDAVIVEAIAAFDAPGSDAQVNATDFDEDVLADRAVAAAITPAFTGNWMWFIGGLLLLILVFLIARYHTLASQYRQGGYMMPQHGGYQPAYAPPPVPQTPAREVDPFVPPSAVPRDESGPVYKPYVPNSL
jgi:hypothetical protein